MQSEQAKPSWISKLIATVFLLLGGLSLAEAKQDDAINSEDKNKLFVSAGFAWSDTWSNSLQHNIGAMLEKCLVRMLGAAIELPTLKIL